MEQIWFLLDKFCNNFETWKLFNYM